MSGKGREQLQEVHSELPRLDVLGNGSLFTFSFCTAKRFADAVPTVMVLLLGFVLNLLQQSCRAKAWKMG